MLFVNTASALNLRKMPGATSDVPILGELRQGDLFETGGQTSPADPWVFGTIMSGLDAGLSGYVRRKWLAQHFSSKPHFPQQDRSAAAQIVRARTEQFDDIVYHLPLTGPGKATTWQQLSASGWIDCSGWIYLLAKEILRAYSRKTKPGFLSTYSDAQVTGTGAKTGLIVSWTSLDPSILLPGVVLGIDFKEYSWDRNRALDIDHIVVIGEDQGGLFVSQSSSSGGGVNRVSLKKWWASVQPLASANRVHAVDLLSLP